MITAEEYKQLKSNYEPPTKDTNVHFIIEDPQKTTRKDDPLKTQKDRGELSQTEDSGRKGERKAGIRKDKHITILNQRLGPKANQPDPNRPHT